jgi:DNA-binding LacI/PurR family transcriptional regulator
MKELPLYKQIQNHLREQILSGKLRPGDRVPSERETAEYFKVSQITSKQALVALMDENMVIRIKGKGTFVAGRNGRDLLQSMQTGIKGIVGIIFPSICMPVESLLFYLIQSLLHEKGYQTLIRVTDDKMDKETEAIRMFRVFGVRGYIIFPAIDENYNDEILRLSLDKFPHVLVDRYLPNITNSSVTSENISGVIKAVHYLMDSGHTQIAFITQDDTNSNTHERIVGFEKANMERKLSIDKKNWLFVKRNNKNDDYEIKTKLHEFFTTHMDITAIFAVDTTIAMLAFAVLHEMGRNIPQDMIMISFDDPKLPFVPFIKQDIESIAKKAVAILISQMENTYRVLRETVPVEFVSEVEYPLPGGI